MRALVAAPPDFAEITLVIITTGRVLPLAAFFGDDERLEAVWLAPGREVHLADRGRGVAGVPEGGRERHGVVRDTPAVAPYAELQRYTPRHDGVARRHA